MADYFVAYHRDVETERRKNYQGRMLFDHIMEFDDLGKASNFALENLPAVLARKLPVSSEDESRIKSDQYAVAGQFEGKFTHGCYDGSTDYLTTYDVVRCAKQDLEAVVDSLTVEERVKKIIVGIELSLYT